MPTFRAMLMEASNNQLSSCVSQNPPQSYPQKKWITTANIERISVAAKSAHLREDLCV